jgi:hypothetical protein
MRTPREKAPALKDREATPKPVRPEGGCQHHWIIETPSGPVSRGVCKLCGEQRAFKNYLDAPYWEDDLSLDQVSSGARFRLSAVDEPAEGQE